ncbi:MAG: hypothetical protein ACRD3W_29075 [Terriglobales bacterium]
MIDWNAGDDAQYWSLLPITKAESDELNSASEDEIQSTLEKLGSNRTYLVVDYPTGKPPRIGWSNGPLIIGPHD